MATGLTKTALTRHTGREARTDQQAIRSLPRPAGGDRHQGNQEERRIRDPRHRPPGEGRAQGPHGPQPADRRGHQDQGQDRCEVPRGQGRQGRDRAPEEVAFFLHCRGSETGRAQALPFALRRAPSAVRAFSIADILHSAVRRVSSNSPWQLHLRPSIDPAAVPQSPFFRCPSSAA